MATAARGTPTLPAGKSSPKAEGTISTIQDSNPEVNGRKLNLDVPNPIRDLLSSLEVLPSAEQAFGTDPTALSQNGSAFLGILADLQNSIKSIDGVAFACSPHSVINAKGLPPLPNSLFKTPLRDRKRVRQVQDQQSQLLSIGLNVKPRLVLVPSVPSSLRTLLNAEEAWSSRDQLQDTLDRYHESTFAQSSESTIRLQIANWQASQSVAQSSSASGQHIKDNSPSRLNVHLKVEMGRPTALWGYICFSRRKRRYEGRFQNRQRGIEIAAAKRLKLSNGIEETRNPDENEEGEAVIATRFHLFAEVEINKGRNDLSDFRWIQELCMHLNYLELSLPELLHRLPVYSDIMQETCRLCSSLLKRGVPPVGRAFLSQVGAATGVSDSGTGEPPTGDRDQDMQANLGPPSCSVVEATVVAPEGRWVAFHSACL